MLDATTFDSKPCHFHGGAVLNSNPKAYNLDKILEFLTNSRSVFLFYFVGIDPRKIIDTALVSMFQRELLQSTVVLGDWSERNSRGVTQFEGRAIYDLILSPDAEISDDESVEFLRRVISL